MIGEKSEQRNETHAANNLMRHVQRTVKTAEELVAL